MTATFTRLRADRLNDRIDAVYYRSSFIANEERLLNSSVAKERLVNLVSEGRRAVYFSTTTVEREEAPADWVPFLTSEDIDDSGCFIDLDARRRVSPAFADRYPNGNLRGNELLVKVKGPNQTTAYNETPPALRVLVSGTIWGALVRKDRVDPHYLVAVLSSAYAAVARARLRTNLNVEFMSPDDLKTLLLPLPGNPDAQTYIGNKVRQAERLRARAKERLTTAKVLVEALLHGQITESDLVGVPPILPSLENVSRSSCVTPTRSTRIQHEELSTSRLDADYYGQHYRRVRQLIERFVSVITLEDVRQRSQPIRRGIDMPRIVKQNTAPRLVTIAAFANPGIDFSALEGIDPNQHEEFSGSQIQPGDLVVAMGGYPGRAAICPKNAPPANIGRHSARIVIDPAKADAHYLWAFITSNLGQVHFKREITGSVQAGINLEDLRKITIPTPSLSSQTIIGGMVREAEQLYECVRFLLELAKALVEGLIDSNVNEDDLQAAHTDRCADWSILRRLTAKGLGAADEPPLFPDLTQLETILADPGGPAT
jgi:type I restriction enzyme S subunit